MSLSSAKAISAAAKLTFSVLASMPPIAEATTPSVSARFLTRSTLVANRGSAASAAAPKTSRLNFLHSRSLWIETSTRPPSAVSNTP